CSSDLTWEGHSINTAESPKGLMVMGNFFTLLVALDYWVIHVKGTSIFPKPVGCPREHKGCRQEVPGWCHQGSRPGPVLPWAGYVPTPCVAPRSGHPFPPGAEG